MLVLVTVWREVALGANSNGGGSIVALPALSSFYLLYAGCAGFYAGAREVALGISSMHVIRTARRLLQPGVLLAHVAVLLAHAARS